MADRRYLALLSAPGSSQKKGPETQDQCGGKTGDTGGQYLGQPVTTQNPSLGPCLLPFSVTTMFLRKGELGVCLWDTPAGGHPQTQGLTRESQLGWVQACSSLNLNRRQIEKKRKLGLDE